jgi:large subunit ribosomal protein L24
MNVPSEKLHVRKGDTVKIISGKDKGKSGKVLKAIPEKNRILVDGINVVKRHTRPRPPKVPQGGILEKALPISASNAMIVCKNPKCAQPVRVAHKIFEDGHKGRYCRKCGEEL